MKTKKTMILISLIIFIIYLAGCTTKAWYEGGQYGAEHNCHTQPPSEIEQCLRTINKKTYQTYQEERKVIK